ncbi:MAG: tetratricopeptide repeat protein [Candidatus Heimdallarchaeota archaeon]
MLAGKNKELQRNINLKNKGKFSEASEKLTEFEKKNHKPETSIRAQIIKALLTANMGSWEKGLGIIEAVISKCGTIDNPLLLIDALFVKAQCLLWGEQYKKSNTLIEETEKILEENLKPDEDDYRIRKAWLLWSKGTSFSWMGDGKRALEIAKQGFTIVQSLNDSEILLSYYDLLGSAEFHLDAFEDARVHFQAGLQLAKDNKNDFKIYLFSSRLTEVYLSIGKFNLALEYNDLTIEYSKKIGGNPDFAIFYKSFIYWYSGEIEKSVELMKGVLPSLENETTLSGRAFVLAGKAVVEWVEGDLDKTIEYVTEAINLMKKRDDVYRTNLISILLARVFFDKGEFDKALEVCFSILDTYKDNKKPVNNPSVFYEMGKVYHVKGDYNLALEYVQKALKLWKRINTILWLARSLFTLLQISIDKNDKVLYTKYLEELEAFVKDNPTSFLEEMYQTAQALVLKASSRPRDWTKAADILVEVVKEKFTKHGFVVIALINLCELLMNEFSMSGDAQVLEELELYIDELSELAQMQNVHHLRLEANNLQIMMHWLKAQKSMVELDFQKAKTLLNSTRKIADDEGMYRLSEKLVQQQEKLLKQMSQWDDFIRKYYEFIKE